MLHDAFGHSQTNARVRINAAILLRQDWLQTALGANGFSKMLLKVSEACKHASSKLDAKMPEPEATSQPKAQTGQQTAPPKDLDNPNAELEELCHTLVSCPVEQAKVLSSCAHLNGLPFKEHGRFPPKPPHSAVDAR